MDAQFVGRTQELQQLRKKIDSSGSNISVVYGRRRIGKSMLIRAAFGEQPVLIFEGLENRSKREQLRHFLFQLRIQAGTELELPTSVRDWRDAFLLLYQYLQISPHHIVFDEFQWMANYRREIVSDLKPMWDQYLSRIPGTSLVLCGSIASFMTTKVIRSNALYGRVDLELHVQAFHLSETREMLAGRGMGEVLDAQLLTGGVPKYLELIKAGPSVHLAVEEMAFSQHGYWVAEFSRIFISHFGKRDSYEKIIKAMASRPYGLSRSDLSASAGVSGGQLSEQLRDLEAAGFISSHVPVDRGVNSKTIRYYLTDAYLRFYFAFIQPAHRTITEKLCQDHFSSLRQGGSFYPWMGRAFEYCCVQHRGKIADILGFPGISYSAGPWFRSGQKGSGFQADLVFDRSDHVLTLCEMKYTLGTVGIGVIDEVEQKVNRLSPLVGQKTVQKVLITKSQPSEELAASGYFYRIIQASELC